MRNSSALVLRLSGVLVLLAGGLHLWMTDHVLQLLPPASGETSEIARAAMLLNHLVVGILLLPLGASLFVIDRPLERREGWARTIGLASSAALLAIPAVLLATARAQMLAAPAFVTAAAMLVLAAVLVAGAVFRLGFARPRSDPG